MRGRITLAAGATIAAFALSAVPAAADHHLIKISEVNAGHAGEPTHEFVEVQMYASGQGNLDYRPSRWCKRRVLRRRWRSNDEFVFPDGRAIRRQPAHVPVRTTPETDSGSRPDREYLDRRDRDGRRRRLLHSTVFASPIDCVTWGSMTNPPPSAGHARAGVRCRRRLVAAPQYRRAAATSCSTRPTTRTPPPPTSAPTRRARASTPTPPTERACPETRFTKKPKKETTKRKAKFKFDGDPGDGH